MRLFRIAFGAVAGCGVACSGGGGDDTGAAGKAGAVAAGAGGKSGAAGASARAGSAPIELDDDGKAELDGAEGITGKVEATTYTANLTAEVRDYGDSYKYILIEAQGAKGTWTLGLPKKIGEHWCGSHTEIANGEIAYILGPAGTGTAGPVANSACKVEVLSFEEVVEGRFAGILLGEAMEPMTLSAGYFYVERE